MRGAERQDREQRLSVAKVSRAEVTTRRFHDRASGRAAEESVRMELPVVSGSAIFMPFLLTQLKERNRTHGSAFKAAAPPDRHHLFQHQIHPDHFVEFINDDPNVLGWCSASAAVCPPPHPILPYLGSEIRSGSSEWDRSIGSYTSMNTGVTVYHYYNPTWSGPTAYTDGTYSWRFASVADLQKLTELSLISGESTIDDWTTRATPEVSSGGPATWINGRVAPGQPATGDRPYRDGGGVTAQPPNGNWNTWQGSILYCKFEYYCVDLGTWGRCGVNGNACSRRGDCTCASQAHDFTGPTDEMKTMRVQEVNGKYEFPIRVSHTSFPLAGPIRVHVNAGPIRFGEINRP